MIPERLPERIAIVGSRGWVPLVEVRHFVLSLPEGSVIALAGAVGVSQWAHEAAKRKGLETKMFFPDHGKYGHQAPRVRNNCIAEFAEIMFAFFDNDSRETWHAMQCMKAMGKEVRVRRMRE